MTDTPSATAQTTGSTSEKARVLVCDDSKIVRLSAKKMLAERCDLVLAEDGQEGWELIEKDPNFQVVFTDLGMPNLDGRGLIERVRASDDEKIQSIPLIVITGNSETDEIKNELFQLGATDFISKPFKPADLIARTDAHSKYQKLNEDVKRNAGKDSLTGSLNSEGIHAQLEKDFAFVERHKGSLAVMTFEVDNFASISERIGKKVSSMIIQEVSKLLNKAVRKEDSVARTGQIRFVVSLPMAKSDSVVDLAKRLCKRIDSFKIKVGNETLTLTSSAGISTAPQESNLSVETLLEKSQTALDSARERGLGEVELFELASNDQATEIKDISIDQLIEKLNAGTEPPEKEALEAAAHKLNTLISLLEKHSLLAK